MQKTEEHARMYGDSLATWELITYERNKGKSLRQLGQMLTALKLDLSLAH